MEITKRHNELGNLTPPTKSQKDTPKKQIKTREAKMEEKTMSPILVSVLSSLIVGAILMVGNYCLATKATKDNNATMEMATLASEAIVSQTKQTTTDQNIEKMDKRIDALPTKIYTDTEFQTVDVQLKNLGDKIDAQSKNSDAKFESINSQLRDMNSTLSNLNGQLHPIRK